MVTRAATPAEPPMVTAASTPAEPAIVAPAGTPAEPQLASPAGAAEPKLAAPAEERAAATSSGRQDPEHAAPAAHVEAEHAPALEQPAAKPAARVVPAVEGQEEMAGPVSERPHEPARPPAGHTEPEPAQPAAAKAEPEPAQPAAAKPEPEPAQKAAAKPEPEPAQPAAAKAEPEPAPPAPKTQEPNPVHDARENEIRASAKELQDPELAARVAEVAARESTDPERATNLKRLVDAAAFSDKGEVELRKALDRLEVARAPTSHHAPDLEALASAEQKLGAGVTPDARENTALLDSAVAKARAGQIAEAGSAGLAPEQALAPEQLGGACGPTQGRVANELVEKLEKAGGVVALHSSHQDADMPSKLTNAGNGEGVNHYFTVVKMPDGSVHLVDPTFPQFMHAGTADGIGGAGSRLLETDHGTALAKALLNDGHAVLTPELAREYAYAITGRRLDISPEELLKSNVRLVEQGQGKPRIEETRRKAEVEDRQLRQDGLLGKAHEAYADLAPARAVAPPATTELPSNAAPVEQPPLPASTAHVPEVEGQELVLLPAAQPTNEQGHANAKAAQGVKPAPAPTEPDPGAAPNPSGPRRVLRYGTTFDPEGRYDQAALKELAAKTLARNGVAINTNQPVVDAYGPETRTPAPIPNDPFSTAGKNWDPNANRNSYRSTTQQLLYALEEEYPGGPIHMVILAQGDARTIRAAERRLIKEHGDIENKLDANGKPVKPPANFANH
jgi:hypothetical protein